ncbi:serine-threonine protein kinase [Streptomyces gamaensis]|uniref:Serine-threonine protein kinase n=1 Tax=Streptomyces gamaensis TaxID=1763542 RepID=A0ABW0YS04_9ACTN
MPGTRVEPYWELTFDAAGTADPREEAGLFAGVTGQGVTDLVFFAHGWNNDRSSATDLYDRFFGFFPPLLDGRATGRGRVGYVGVVWPSMAFSDEPVPTYPKHQDAVPEPAAGLSPATRTALVELFSYEPAAVDRMAELLVARPEDPAALEEFARLVRGPARSLAAASPALTRPPEPLMFTEDARAVCGRFGDALAGLARGTAHAAGEGARRLWDGAAELLRQATYYTMKHRAGTVGHAGLGPLLGRLAAAAPAARCHLAGHSFGARLMSFAVRALPPEAGCVASLTLIQGAFSHYAFAERLPFDAHGGALAGAYGRVGGPVVCCHSRHDTALGVLYPIASAVAGDDESFLGIDGDRWGAMGHDGIQEVDGCPRLTIAEALGGALPDSGCVNVDASAVVAHGGPPAGAHCDICHPELARVIALAGRLTG